MKRFTLKEMQMKIAMRDRLSLRELMVSVSRFLSKQAVVVELLSRADSFETL